MPTPNLLLANSPAATYAATDASGATRLLLPRNCPSIRVVNESADIAFFAVDEAPTATLPGAAFTKTCTPVLGGSDVIFSLPASSNSLSFAAICRSAKTATLTVQTGYGS